MSRVCLTDWIAEWQLSCVVEMCSTDIAIIVVVGDGLIGFEESSASVVSLIGQDLPYPCAVSTLLSITVLCSLIAPSAAAELLHQSHPSNAHLKADGMQQPRETFLELRLIHLNQWSADILIGQGKSS